MRNIIISLMKTINFVTTNREKILELQRIASSVTSVINIEPTHFTGEEPEENGNTFAENSEIKFLFYENHLNSAELLITEDSGFEITELENFPSIHSARFLKQFHTKQEAFEEIGKMLFSKTGKNSSHARFVCDICTRINGEIKHFYATTEGELSFENHRNEGFGYDPIFIPTNSTKTFSEMSGIEKDRFSHRAQAFKQLLHFISC